MAKRAERRDELHIHQSRGPDRAQLSSLACWVAGTSAEIGDEPLQHWILDAPVVLYRGEESRVDDGCANRCPDRAHRCAYRFEGGASGILHQIPSIRDLDRLREVDNRGGVINRNSRRLSLAALYHHQPFGPVVVRPGYLSYRAKLN